jgi:hypothetical protein
MTAAGVDYQRVAVCTQNPAWYLQAWEDLTDDILDSTHLAQADELLVQRGAQYALGPEWRPAEEDYGDIAVYRRRRAARYGDRPPSGAVVMAEVAKPGVSPNAIFCSQGLRKRGGERPDLPFRVAPRYQGLWMEEAVPLDGREAEDRQDQAQQGSRGYESGKRRRIEIGIVDTGLPQGPFLNPWLEEFIASESLVGGDAADPPDPDGNGEIDAPAGHGAFVAGVIAQLVPQVCLHVIRAVGRQGAVSDAQLAATIDRLAASGLELDILNLSLGGWTHNDRKPLMVGDAIDRLPSHTLVVAAAGNLESRRKFWPAAMERVVSVGAVVTDGDGWERAEYSNYGDWVTAVAPDGGRHVPGRPSEGGQVSTFYTAFPQNGRPEYHGWARWRGTSFTTPTVTARIAQTMLADDLRTGLEAWERLREHSAARPPAEFPNAVVVA